MPGVKGMKRSTTVDWNAVDWTKPNWHLAIATGVSESHVAQMRKRLGKPPVVVKLWGRNKRRAAA